MTDIFNRLLVADVHKKNWRLMACFLEELSIATQYLSCRLLCLGVYDKLFNLLKDPKVIEALKPSLARAVSLLIYNNQRITDRY